jgi:MFS family permease
VKDLGGFSQFPWLFSVYLLTQAVTVPIYGKLADLFGRKPVMSWGVAVFVLGSLLCAVAWSMPSLIAARAVQGVGAGLLTVGCSLLILGLLEGGNAWAWSSATSALVLVSAVAALVAFGYVERSAAEPVLPLWVFRRRVLVGGNLVAVMTGALLVGLSTYVPTYVQRVLGTGPVVAGFALAALTLGWPIAASQSGRVYLRIGFRDTALVGLVFAITGALLATQLTARSPVWHVAAALFVIGLGMGLIGSPLVVAVQSVVGWDRRGVVTGTNMFSRAMGSALGAAAFGALANATLAHRYAHPPKGLDGPLPQGVDETTRALAHPGPVADFARASLFSATHHVFVALAVAVLLMTAAVALVPRVTSPLVFDPE